jgi:hypothetical protein
MEPITRRFIDGVVHRGPYDAASLLQVVEAG